MVQVKIVRDQIVIPPQGEKQIRLKCPTGFVLTGGGFTISPDGRITASCPVTTNTWMVIGRNPLTQGGILLQAFAVCVKVP